ncbi:thiamine pyrophosphokinase, vitamin B1-binding domain-containing protein [Fomitopsis serialis]|uniref:thiamine pyrophosphokinase, vitamin B1-binding domain-containing protein n=1 Tax=Fomitopsis serialis TaxID=139415 RepID=UPI0020078A6B|nr:thiamine pyrophosphokinase, vitamin B1-binding domain-containing protein [Neoantrodia serialis]KAH9928620.1 thiamine pyrophosphokinase, vitamin B1-binding domain-containing protein [Neoantrodia serialis]
MSAPISWSLPFFEPSPSLVVDRQYALIILNQPCSFPLLRGSGTRGNRLYDVLTEVDAGGSRGDLDSLRDDGVPVVYDPDLYATDLMKCIRALEERDAAEGIQSDLIILGGLSGRLDQTVHTLSLLHKRRSGRMRIFAATDDNLAWVLDSGTHHIPVNHDVFGPTCGLLPVGIDSTVLTTTGLRWNLTDAESSFGGLVSTSNHLVPEEKVVTITTSKPIWWTMELRPEGCSEEVRLVME